MWTASTLVLTGAGVVGAAVDQASAASADVVISQVYGGGGNSGATYRNDYVELTNRGAAAVDLTGWSVQFASAGGTSWQVTPLSGSVAAGATYLVQEAAGAGGTTSLPTPGASGSVALSATAGKVALATVTTALTCAGVCHADGAVRDYVGYGTATDFEGAGPAPAPSNTTADLRGSRPDTDDNASDFVAGPPAPGSGSPTPPPSAGTDCSAADTTIGAVQGSTDTSPSAGRTVSVQGTVVSDDEGPSPALRGFYVQGTGDGDPATSDGVFVLDNLGGVSPDLVSVGQVVQVTGPVSEFQGQTQVTATRIDICGTGTTVTPVDVTLPRASAGDLEPFEGMLVRLHQTLTVTELFQLGRFGQVVVSSGGRLRQPTSLFPGGDPRVTALQTSNDLNRLIIDDGTNAQNPDPIVFGRNGAPLSASNTLRGGDTVTDPVGVLTYTWAGNAASGNAYRLRPVNALGGVATFVAANPRPSGVPAVGGNVTVASSNLLNFFNTFGVGACTFGLGGAAADCRGAGDATEYDRQLAKEVAALRSLDADVVGVMELENDGYGPASAIRALVDALNAADGAGAWAFVDPDAATGTVNAAGTDAIKAALLYRTARATPVAGATSTDTAAGVFERNPVAQTFTTSTGARVTVIANHFKSKGSCPAAGDPNADAGDGQGCWNVRRTAQATELARWFRDVVVPTAGSPDVMVVGDLNSYAEEDPIKVLESAGFVNLPRAFHGDQAYSYAFDGQWGYLDYVMASAALAPKATGADDVHINADEPSVLDYNTDFKSAAQVASLYAPDRFRNSDHDPVLAGLNLGVAASFAGDPASTATVGLPYSAGFTPSGSAPVGFAVTSGELPAGLTLSADGQLTGVPTAAGTAAFEVTATNGYGAVSRSFTTTVSPGATTTSVESSAPSALLRTSLSWTATVTGGAGAPAPSGTVQFKAGPVNLGAPVRLVAGSAVSPSTTRLPPGATTITALYSGDPNWSAGTATYRQSVTLHIDVVSPKPDAAVRAGSSIPIQFRLTDAVGPVPDLVAFGYLLTGNVAVSAVGAQTLPPRCPTYDPTTKLFRYSWGTTRRATGTSTIDVTVSYPGLAAQTVSTSIALT